MKRKKGFTLIELLVVIAIIALLLAILMPSLRKAKQVAQSVVCRSNLRQWGLIWAFYTDDYEGKFPWGNYKANDQEINSWLVSLLPYYENNKIRLCPTATKLDAAIPFKAWGRDFFGEDAGDGWRDDATDEGLFMGSYGINDYAHSPTGGRNLSNPRFWRTRNVRGANTAPLFCDASYWKIREPASDDARPKSADNAEGVGGALRNVCLDRHNGYINMIFMDLHAGQVGLKGIWMLPWHRDWVPDAGARNDEPDWWGLYMKQFKY